MVNNTSPGYRPRAAAGLGLLVVLLLGSPLQAQDSAQKLLAQGRYLAIQKKKCYKALAVLEEARKLAKTSRVRGSIYLHIAVCSLHLGNKDAARAALREALIQNSRLASYAGRYGKAMQGLFAELKAVASGMLSVISDRPGSVVTVDGLEKGPAPFLGQIPVGPHNVEVKTPDGRWRHRESVVIDKGGYVSVNCTLQQVEGMLTVLSNPTGVKVYVDGEIVGSTPVHKTPLVPGAHTITVRRYGFVHQSRKVKISEDRLTSISFTLKPLGRGPPVHDGSSPWGSQRRFVWTWVAGGGALVALTVGVGLGISIKSDAEEYAAASEDQTQRLDDLEQTMRGKALGANVLFGISGALVATSVVLFFWEGGWFGGERRPGRRTSSLTGRVTPVISPGGAGLMWTTDF